MQPFLSIIVPFYNAESYLAQCLNSAVNQTERDLEIIVVDDGSTDDSAKIAQEFADVDRRISVIHKKNGGISSARNIGLQLSKGRYICFLDSDDWLDLEAAKILKSVIDKKEYDTVMFSWDIISAETNRVTRPAPNFRDGFVFDENSKAEIYEKVFMGAPLKTVWQRIYRNDLIKRQRLIFDENQKYGSDMIFSLDFLMNCHNGIYIDKNLYIYRKNWSSLTHTFDINKVHYLKRVNLLLLSRLETLDSTDIARYREIFAFRYTKDSLRSIMRLFRLYRTANSRERYDYLWSVINDDYFQSFANNVKSKDFGLILAIELWLAKKKMGRTLWYINTVLNSRIGQLINRIAGLQLD